MWGKDEDTKKLSQLCNDMWRAGWRAGNNEKLRRKISIPDEHMGARSILEDNLNAQFVALTDRPRALPDIGFTKDERVVVQRLTLGSDIDNLIIGHIFKLGEVIHTVNIPSKAKTFYLIKFKNKLDMAYIPGEYLAYPQCRR